LKTEVTLTPFAVSEYAQNSNGYDRVNEAFRDPKTGKPVLIEPAEK
jgi:hypothetical protein